MFKKFNFFKKKAFTKQLRIEPPTPHLGRHGIAIVTCVKNEAEFIRDWVIFHRAVGIRHFYIYDNGSSDGTVNALNALGLDDITIFPWSGRMSDAKTGEVLNHQVIAWAAAVLNFGAHFKWMAFIDVDEFLLPKSGVTVEEALKPADGFPNISLPWHMFGTSGHKQRPAGSILRNFTVRGADPMSRLRDASNFKCIVDPCEVTVLSVHQFETKSFGDLTSNDAGKRATRRVRRLPDFYSSQNLQLNHYYTKSEADLEEKLARGPVSVASHARYRERVLNAVNSIESETTEDRAMVEFLDRIQVGI